jgi:hypothetical protein
VQHGPKAGTVTFEPRDARACQTWQVVSVPGTADYTVRSVEAQVKRGQVACLGSDLTLVRARDAAGCGTWTLLPTDDGTWSLSSGGTTQAVRVLLP